MNWQLIGNLVRLRYRLLWARRRTRAGKMALFFAGYLVLVLVMGLLASGGLGAARAAIRSGKAEIIAQAVLTSLFLWALITSVMLGFGLNSVFADVELRRFPLNARERLVARHFSGMLDPFWLLTTALELGLALGLYLFGVSSFWLGIAAVLLLFACNYLAAQVVARVLDRIMRQRGGSILLPALVIAVCLLPSALGPILAKRPDVVAGLIRAFGYLPTFGAGSLMTRTDLHAFLGFLVVGAWICGLGAALAALELRPPQRRVARVARLQWGGGFEAVGALFGARLAPSVAHWLQFFSRCKRLRINYLLSLPLLAFLLLMWTRQSSPGGDAFAAAAGVFAVAGIMPAAPFVLNRFGYAGSGFRRYFLLPAPPGEMLRASSVALLAMSSVMLPPALLIWAFFGGAPVTVRGLIMLLASGLTGMFLFHGLGHWTTLYAARRANPDQTMGNDLSAAANVLLIALMLVLLVGPQVASARWKGLISPDQWWIAALAACASVLFFRASLGRAEAALVARKEALLAVVEGRD